MDSRPDGPPIGYWCCGFDWDNGWFRAGDCIGRTSGPDPEWERIYVPSPADLDQLCSDISACGYASEAVQVVEDWTREHWAVESAFTTAMNPTSTEEPHG